MNSHKNCQCESLTHETKLVVLTGGPGAGKTAVLELVKRSFCEHIVVLPEAASILFGGGFWRKESLPSKKAAQRAIFHIQRELERAVIEEGRAAIALCDRGTLDGLAYWPEDQSKFFEELGIDRKAELTRYSAVIHLRSPASNQGYNFSNPVRIESAEEAARIDGRIEKAWDGHPLRKFISSETDFLLKAQRAVEAVRSQLPACCLSHRIEALGEK